MTQLPDYDAILLVSFGGPEAPEDIVPFLENVTRGRGIPRERLEQVGAHYHLFGGRSPINDQCRELLEALKPALAEAGIDLPVYWGNRNWTPMLQDTVQQMANDGIKHALAFVTSATSSYSGCRQYRENILAAREAVDGSPMIDKIRQYYDHPGFIEPMIDNVQHALTTVPEGSRLVFTAHSIPLSMATSSDYEAQLREASRLIADGVGHHDWDLVWQSRSGPPQVPWLDPDVNDHLDSLAATGDTAGVVVVPVGFISDHMEVMYDLDTEAMATAERLNLPFARAATVGVDARFVSAIVELIEERRSGVPKRALGDLEVRPDVCREGCCPAPQRPQRPAQPA
jgi:ferrochelatase